MIEEKFVVFLGKGLLALDDLGKVSVHHLRYDITKSIKFYTSSNYSLDFGKTKVYMLIMFSCFSNFSNLSSLNVLLAKILCSKALSIFLIATRSLPSVLASLSFAATTIP